MRLYQTTPDGTSGGYNLPSGIPTDFSVPSVSGSPGSVGGSMSATPMTTAATDPSAFFSSGAPGTTAAAINANPQVTAGPGTTDPTWLTSMNNFLTSPVGQVVGAAVPGTIGLVGAASQQRNAQNLTNAISATARPGQQVSDATYRQMTGGAPVGGPMGNYIAGATGAAGQLAQTAGQYATGNLTPAQQLQVSRNLAAQNAQAYSSLSRPGGMGMDSSAAAAITQQNQNNAAMLTQQIEQNNIAIANAALQGATQTYTALLTSALNQAQLGAQATADAVQQQLKANQAVWAQVQGLIKDIASGMTRSAQPQQPGGGGQATGGGAVAQSPGQTIGQNVVPGIRQVMGWFGGGNNAVPPIAAGAPTWIPQGQQAYDQAAQAAGPQMQDVQLTDIPSTFTPTPADTSGAAATGTGD